jgi:hypothetical protein
MIFNWFKSKPNWLKGGIIGAILGIALSGALFLAAEIDSGGLSIFTKILFFNIDILTVPILEILDSYCEIEVMHNFKTIIFWTILIEFSIFGMLIGCFYGKIKQKRN